MMRDLGFGDAPVQVRPDRDATPADGRGLRRQRNIDRALDAFLALAAEGHVDPSWDDIAERAGVSHRSLYRYFDDRHSLLRAAADRAMAKIGPLIEIPDLGVGTLEQRMSTFVGTRLALYEGFAPIARSAYRSSNVGVVRSGIDASRTLMRAQMMTQFGRELDTLNHEERRRTVALVDLAFQFEAIEYLAQDCGMGMQDVAVALVTHLRVHLEPLAAR